MHPVHHKLFNKVASSDGQLTLLLSTTLARTQKEPEGNWRSHSPWRLLQAL